MKLGRIAIATIAMLALCAGLVACGNDTTARDASSGDGRPAYTVASMKGATSIGLAWAMQERQAGAGEAGDFEFSVLSTADELAPRVAAGDFDFALVPANVAANLYRQSGGKIRAIGINTLGVLYGVSYDQGIGDVPDLAGRTVYLTGKGTVPGYTVEYLVGQASIGDSVELVYASEPSEALAHLANDRSAVAIVPEPFATTALAKDAELARVLDLTELWDESVAQSGASGRFVTGVTVAREDLVEDDQEAVEEFLDLCGRSVQAALDDPSSIAQTLVDLGILGNAGFAQSAIPRCNIVCIRGEEMRDDLSGYLETMWAHEPGSVGGEVPDDGFYYVG